MKTQTLPERLTVLEDELQALDSALDARTRKLWVEIIAIKAMLADLQERMKEVEKCRP